MAQLTVYSTAGDGRTYAQGVQGTWATQRAKTAGDNTDHTTNPSYGMITQDNGGGTIIGRSFFAFDTHLLEGGTITAVTFSVYSSSNYSDTTDSVNIVEGSQASTTEIVANDFDNCGAVKLCDTPVNLALATNAYTDFILNAAGLAVINKSGYTKICLRGTKDIDNTDPSNQANGTNIYFSEEANKGPKLVIDYIPGGDFAGWLDV